MPDEIQIRFEFYSIRFTPTDDGGIALTNGTLKVEEAEGRFGLALAPNAKAEWVLKDTRSTGRVSKLLSNKTVLQALVGKAATLLKTINMWAEEGASETGAKILMNQQLPPPECYDRVFISFRPDMLSLPTSNWVNVWDLVEGRVEGDRFFRVHGFSIEEVRCAIKELKMLFRADWVRARYKRTEESGENPFMAAQLPRNTNGWFPAYHLARTALGAMCIDPGWNYLIEIGLSIQELQGLSRLDELKGQIVRSSGTQHHLCLAAELHRKGQLLGLEPRTGSGSCANDLLGKVGSRVYDIEVKEFSSSEPAKRLYQELRAKAQRMPNRPNNAVVFHAVLIENGVFDKKREERFFAAVQELRRKIPAKISAIVAGRRFVDASGGRVKRDAECRVLNPHALLPSHDEDLAALFSRSYESIDYPLFGIGSFFEFGSESNSRKHA